MTAKYRGEAEPEYDDLLDTITTACAADDPLAIAQLYACGDLSVPAELIC